MLRIKRFINARRILAGVELVQKFIKGQFDLLGNFGTDPLHVWYNVSGRKAPSKTTLGWQDPLVTAEF
jgi:hypothetical protein